MIMMIQPTSWQHIQLSTQGKRRSNFEAPQVTVKVMTMAAPQTGMVMSWAFEETHPSSVRMVGVKEEMAPAVKSQQKKHMLRRCIRQSRSTY